MNINIEIETKIFLLESKNLKEGPIKSIKNIYSKLSSTDQQRINKTIIRKIADLFEEPFAKYLEKNLNEKLNLVDIASVISQAQNGEDEGLNKLKYTFIDIMIDYYESLLKRKLFKKSITGDKTLDNAYSRAITDLFSTPELVDRFYENMNPILNDKFENIKDIELNEANKTKNVFRYLKSFGDKSKMQRYKISDKLLSYIPNVNKKLKKYIHNLIMNMDKKILDKLHGNWDIRNVANALSEPVIKYIHHNIEQKYLNQNPDLKIFNRVLKDLLDSNQMENLFKEELIRLFNVKKLATKS